MASGVPAGAKRPYQEVTASFSPRGGHFGREGGGFGRGHAQHAQLARAHEGHHAGKAAEGDGHLAAGHFGGGGARATVGHVGHFDVFLLFQHFAQQVIEGAVAGGGVVEIGRAHV